VIQAPRRSAAWHRGEGGRSIGGFSCGLEMLPLTRRISMKHNVYATSHLALDPLLTLHLRTTSSVGYRRRALKKFGWPFSWCCCTGRWCSPNGDRGTSMMLVRVVAAGMPVIHMRGAHYGEIAKSTGASLRWTPWALARSGASPHPSRRADCGA